MTPSHPDSMTTDELIGRMLMFGVRGTGPSDPIFRADLEACRSARVGGVILFDVHLPEFTRRVQGGDPPASAKAHAARNIISRDQAAALAAEVRSALGADAIISIDQEGGDGDTGVARLNPRRGFVPTPTHEALSRMSPSERAAALATLVADVRAVGCDLNFSPCVDAKVNPESPVIAKKQRCLGSDADHIAALAAEITGAHARAGVLSCLKHFPGHGSAEGDTHSGFVDITRTWRADPELAVYHALLPRVHPGWTLVMPGHVFHAQIDPDHPASLSRAHIHGMLRGVLGFEGVVVTDSLDMGAVTGRYGRDEALLLAINAGADILLDGVNAPAEDTPHPAPLAHEAIARALRDGRIVGGESRLRESARRIARLQRWSNPATMR